MWFYQNSVPLSVSVIIFKRLANYLDRISTGQAVWGFPVRQCEVMYLCLEDTLDRLQRRLVEVTGGESGRIYLATQAEIMGSGLEEQLVNFLTGHPEVGLVISFSLYSKNVSVSIL